MFGKKFFDIVTPYNRIFLTIQLEDNDVITLPAKNTAVFFLTNGDTIMLDEMDSLDELVFLDYGLLDPKSETKFLEDFQAFKKLAKKELLKDQNLIFTVVGKIIYGKNCNIMCKIYDESNQ